jgi:clan AA aspartic protease (TIGR02281 family)
MDDRSPFSITLDLLKRFGILGIGAIALLLVMSYHPDAAQDHFETVLANKQEALAAEAHRSLVFTGSEQGDPTPDTHKKGLPLEKDEHAGFFKSLWMHLPWNKQDSQNKAVVAIDSILSSTNMTSVPMALNPKALFVNVKVNDSVHGHFILDTGATYTTISRKMAKELGLDLTNTQKISITTANGELQVPKVQLKTVTVNNIQAQNVEATVMDFEESSAFSGLLGLSFIQHFKLTLDPENGQMVFEPIR